MSALLDQLVEYIYRAAASRLEMRVNARPIISLPTQEAGTCIGIYFGPGGAETFWQITCPCGVKATYPVNGLPTANTPHPCGKPNHWAVQYERVPEKPGP